MSYGKAFEGTVECPECEVELTVFSDVRRSKHEIDECPDCGAQDVVMEIVGDMEGVEEI